LLPNLSALVLGGYEWGQGRSTVSNLHSDTASTAVSALTLQWLLFDFGQRSARLDAARQQTAMADIAFTAEHQNVIYKVSLAFYAHAAARARAANAITAAKDAQDVQAAAEDRLHHGIGTIVEVARARQAAAQATLALVQARVPPMTAMPRSSPRWASRHSRRSRSPILRSATSTPTSFRASTRSWQTRWRDAPTSRARTPHAWQAWQAWRA
jgi:hypothetical protein